MSILDVNAGSRRAQVGSSLIELVMFIMIVSVAVVGVLAVMNTTTRASSDPLVRKQALAIAESLLEEIELQPFTYCDPDDTLMESATGAFAGAGGCSSGAQVQGGAMAGETRYGPAFFDNVNDYNGFTMPVIRDINNIVLPELANYSITTPVAITQVGATFGLAAAEVLRIDVTVNYTGGSVLLTGYRFRYAPNSAA